MVGPGKPAKKKPAKPGGLFKPARPKAVKYPVVVVEEDENIAMYLRLMLKKEGFQPVMAYDGHQALALMTKYKAPRCVLMDIKLPYVDGVQLVHKIRAHKSWMNVPIILLTSVSEELVINRA